MTKYSSLFLVSLTLLVVSRQISCNLLVQLLRASNQTNSNNNAQDYEYCTEEERKSSQMEKFNEHQVVSDVLASAPEKILSVEWSDSHVKADLGNEVTPTQIQHKPKIHFQNADAHAFYTLIMADPDAPSRDNPKNGEWLHWMVNNIPGDNVSQGHSKAGYVGAGPPQGTGLHRYVLMIFKQTKGKQEHFDDFPTLSHTTSKHRSKFNTKSFAKKHHLELVAANFVQAQWDHYVPKLYEQFTD